MNIISTASQLVNYDREGLRQTFHAWAGDFVADYDIEAVIDDWQKAIDEALPDGVVIYDIGLAEVGQCDATLLEIIEAIEAVDLNEIANRHLLIEA